MEIYLKGKKVGFSETKVSPHGKDRLIEEKMVLALNLMGQASVMRMSSRAVVDKGVALKRFHLKMDSGVVRFDIRGKVKGNRLHVEMGEGAQKKDLVIPLSGPITMGSSLPAFFKGRSLAPGDVFRFNLFDPSVLSHKEVVIRVAAKTVMPVNGKECPFSVWKQKSGGRSWFSGWMRQAFC